MNTAIQTCIIDDINLESTNHFMYTFPYLSHAEQLDLPQLIAKPTVMPRKFVDSTHQLWHCETVDGPMVLKVCDEDSIVKSSFWFAMNQLFNADFPNSLGSIQHTYRFLNKTDLLQVPAFVASGENRFVLTHYIAGEDVDARSVTEAMVIQLALHIAHLHQCVYSQWGVLHAPLYGASEWSERLHKTLQQLIEKNHVSMSHPIVQGVMNDIAGIQEIDFVPVMLDLRWDQFRISKAKDNTSGQLSLIDLDAFVIAPPALALVLIEYLLTAEQLCLFRSTYTTLCQWPEFALQKSAYQLLLFLMNVLGETDLEKWMTDI